LYGKDIVALTGNQSANREYKHEPAQPEKPVYSTTVTVAYYFVSNISHNID